MRMDRSRGETAAEVLAALPERELAELLRDYGEERHSRRIAQEIHRERRKEPIVTTARLAGIVERAAGGKWQRIHPATRTFQALRIAVNRELSGLEEWLGDAIDLLSPGGRMVVIAFHSLEDRIVKVGFRDRARDGEVAVLTKRPVGPGPEEEEANPRSRSARLRAVRKL